MTKATIANKADSGALDRLIEREEVLQICYWYQGEGFGDSFTPQAVVQFLQCDVAAVEVAFALLVQEGELRDEGKAFVFSEKGRRKAGKMFFETFTEFQQGGHGECHAGCCDGDEPCPDHGAGHGHVHAHNHAGGH